MRYFVIFLAAVGIWLAGAELSAAQTASALMKSGDGSLILGGSDKKIRVPSKAAPKKKDTLHTLLSREVQVYIFRRSTRVWPKPYFLGQTRYYRSARRFKSLAGPYLENLIRKYSFKYGVDPSLVRALMRHESGFNPHAVSPKGAQGLMQLMPGTAALMGVKNPFDPEQNIAGGVGYLRFCLDRFQQNVPLAVAAYNAGPGRVAKSKGVPAIPETQAFVKNVMGTYSGRSPATISKAKHKVTKKAKKRARKSLNDRILPTSPRPPSTQAKSDERSPRRRAKVIEVRFPKTKRVVVAKPKGAQ